MNIFTIEIDKQIFLVCNQDMRLVFSDEDMTIDQLVELAVNGTGAQFPHIEIVRLARVLANFKPKSHDVDWDDDADTEDIMYDLTGNNAEAILLNRKDNDDIALSLVQIKNTPIRETGVFLKKELPEDAVVLYTHPTKTCEQMSALITRTIH